jgi:hypothetical protein
MPHIEHMKLFHINIMGCNVSIFIIHSVTIVYKCEIVNLWYTIL